MVVINGLSINNKQHRWIMIKVLAKIDAVMRVIRQNPGVGFGTIQTAVGIHKATLSQILASMVECGWLDRSDDGSYDIGEEIVEYARPRMAGKSLLHAVEEAVTWLSNETGETASGSTLLGSERVRLAKRLGHHELAVDEDRLRVPQRLLDTATGRLLLAYQPRERTIELIRNEGGQPDDVLDELIQTVETGVSVYVSSSGHMTSYARGVFSDRGVLLAAVGLNVPTHTLNEKRTDEVLTALGTACAIAEKVLRLAGGCE